MFFLHQPLDHGRRMTTPAQVWRCEHGCQPRHETVAAVQARVEAVPFRSRQELTCVIDEGEALQMLPAPPGPQLGGVPLGVRRASQSLVPQWIREIEDLIEERAFGRSETHR